MERFVNRKNEFSRLRDCYESDDADIVVIFGRRRLEKTKLVRESLGDRDDTVLYQATETTRQIQLDSFADVAAASFPEIDRIERGWESSLGYLADQDAVIVLDEFPYLIDADESLPSVVQRLWDQELRKCEEKASRLSAGMNPTRYIKNHQTPVARNPHGYSTRCCIMMCERLAATNEHVHC